LVLGAIFAVVGVASWPFRSNLLNYWHNIQPTHAKYRAILTPEAVNVPRTNARGDPRVMRALMKLKERPTTTIPKAMKLADFTPQECVRQAKGMWIYRRWETKCAPPPKNVSFIPYKKRRQRRNIGICDRCHNCIVFTTHKDQATAHGGCICDTNKSNCTKRKGQQKIRWHSSIAKSLWMLERPLFNKLHWSLITSPISVRFEHLTARKIAELYSSNCGIQPCYTACCFN
jgi:hypothetical protein